MLWVLQREHSVEDSIPGHILLLGEQFCYSLERRTRAIKPGVYGLSRYFSPANQREVLLLSVPGRQFIEIHPANFAYQLKGCIAPGERQTKSRTAIHDSISAFRRLTDVSFAALERHEVCEIAIKDPDA